MRAGNNVSAVQHEAWLAQLPLLDASFDVWLADLIAAAPIVPRLRSLLSADEAHRAEGYRAETDFRRFVAARAALRILLADRLATTPAEIHFVYSEHGKPALANIPETLHFNIAHAHELALLTFSRTHRVGADIEFLGTEVDIEGLSQRFFSASEKCVFARLDRAQRPSAFLRAWSRKEAIAKAYGMGLSMPFREIDVPVGALASPHHTAHYSLYDPPVPSEYIASVAVLHDQT